MSRSRSNQDGVWVARWRMTLASAVRPWHPLVVAVLVGKVGEPATQVVVGIAQPVPLGRVAQQELHHGQTEQFGVAEQRAAATAARPIDEVIDRHLQCGGEGVQIGVHKGSSSSTSGEQRPILDPLATATRQRPAASFNGHPAKDQSSRWEFCRQGLDNPALDLRDGPAACFDEQLE
jgi:hypothetical protein